MTIMKAAGAMKEGKMARRMVWGEGRFLRTTDDDETVMLTYKEYKEPFEFYLYDLLADDWEVVDD